MFIGLNPSTADETQNDPTIKRVISFARQWGYGGVYMCNCFPYISTDPAALQLNNDNSINDQYLKLVADECKTVVFAWGAFEVVRSTGRDQQLTAMFPGAMALQINADGSPRHPLYVPSKTQLINYQLNNN